MFLLLSCCWGVPLMLFLVVMLLIVLLLVNTRRRTDVPKWRVSNIWNGSFSASWCSNTGKSIVPGLAYQDNFKLYSCSTIENSRSSWWIIVDEYYYSSGLWASWPELNNPLGMIGPREEVPSLETIQTWENRAHGVQNALQEKRDLHLHIRYCLDLTHFRNSRICIVTSSNGSFFAEVIGISRMKLFND